MPIPVFNIPKLYIPHGKSMKTNNFWILYGLPKNLGKISHDPTTCKTFYEVCYGCWERAIKKFPHQIFSKCLQKLSTLHLSYNKPSHLIWATWTCKIAVEFLRPNYSSLQQTKPMLMFVRNYHSKPIFSKAIIWIHFSVSAEISPHPDISLNKKQAFLPTFQDISKRILIY